MGLIDKLTKGIVVDPLVMSDVDQRAYARFLQERTDMSKKTALMHCTKHDLSYTGTACPACMTGQPPMPPVPTAEEIAAAQEAVKKWDEAPAVGDEVPPTIVNPEVPKESLSEWVMRTSAEQEFGEPPKPPKPPKKPIDWSKRVWVIGSHEPVEVISTKGRGSWPVMVYIGEDTKVQYLSIDGRSAIGGPVVVENAPEIRQVWINVWANLDGRSGFDDFVITQHRSKGEADLFANNKPGKALLVGHMLEVPVK